MDEKNLRRSAMFDYLTEKYVRIMNAIRSHQEGQTLVEYALLLVLIAVVVIAAVTVVGNKANNVYTNIGSKLGS
jgi:pilus assembly protein Flp/PilA